MILQEILLYHCKTHVFIAPLTLDYVNAKQKFTISFFFFLNFLKILYLMYKNIYTTNIIHNNYKMINNNNDNINERRKKNYIKSNKLFFRVVF